MGRAGSEFLWCTIHHMKGWNSTLNRGKGFTANPKPLKRSRLRLVGVGSASQQKRRIQALLRQIVMERDGGCIFRLVLGNCSETLQAEHLNSRVHSNTFGDTRNIVCLCSYHHIFWKKQNSRMYWELIETHLGPNLWKWLKLAEADKRPYKMDWVLVEVALQQEFKNLKKLNSGIV